MKIFKTGGKETMKNRRFAQLVLMITMLFCLTFGTVCAQAATTATTTTAKAAVKNGWKKEGGQYYYYIKGKKVTNKLKKINGAIYYLGSNGARKTGWYTVKSGNTYKTMQFASNGKYTGKSQKANAELIKMTDSVLRSQKISASLTTTAQKKTALQKLFNYSKKYGYMRMKGFDGKPLQFTKGKSQMFAYLTMGMEKGNCYGVASAFAVQAKRATGLPVRVCWGKSNVFNKNKWQPHGWTEIKIGNTWYTFDANAAGNKYRKDVKYYMQKSLSMKKYYKTEGREDIVL